jgi:hypothetical protein
MKKRISMWLILMTAIIYGVCFFEGCARARAPNPEGRYRVESVFSGGTAWMEFKGDTYWYLAGTAADGQALYSRTAKGIHFAEFGGFENVDFFIKDGKGGSILFFLDLGSSGGRGMLESITGTELEAGDGMNETAAAFNRAIRKNMETLFRRYPFMKLYR